VAINGEKVSDYNDLFLTLEKYNPGDQVKLTVIRDKQQVEIPIVLDASS
jgi:S1-C subfamily serine protease